MMFCVHSRPFVCVVTDREMTGVEYEVSSDNVSDSSYFVIRKQYRDGPDQVRLLNVYYVVGVEPPSPHAPAKGTVFPMPDLHAVLSFNLVRFSITSSSLHPHFIPPPPHLTAPALTHFPLNQQTTSFYYLTEGIGELTNVLHPPPPPAAAAAATATPNTASASAAGAIKKEASNAMVIDSAPATNDSKHSAPPTATATATATAKPSTAAGGGTGTASVRRSPASVTVPTAFLTKLSLADDALASLLVRLTPFHFPPPSPQLTRSHPPLYLFL